VARDTPKWVKGEKGLFSVKTTYNSLCPQGLGTNMNHIWKAKIPLKIKIFMWLVCNNAILTKDNLIKRKWVGDERCSFCCEPESISHLLFGCSMAKYVWSMVAWVLGANCRPTSLEQFWVWIRQILPAGKQFYMSGLATICWGLWIARNSVCFEKK